MLGFGMPGMTEMIVILVIVLIFFGAGKLPEVFAQAGKGLKAFKDASDGRPTGTSADDEDETAKPARKQLAARDPDDLDDEPVEGGASSAQKQRRRPG